MIAPCDHFEILPPEIVKHEITGTDLISTRYSGPLV
jgi:hypothetical protein